MATQICPKCKTNSFTWQVNNNDETIWHCMACNYSAIENESLERICSICETKTELHLKDSDREFWWCNNCNKTNNIK